MGIRCSKLYRKATDFCSKLSRVCGNIDCAVLIVALFFPLAGFLIAFVFQKQVIPDGTGFAVAIWWILGFVPVWVWLIRREYILNNKPVDLNIFSTIIGSLILLFGGVFKLFILTFFAVIIFVLLSIVYYFICSVYFFVLYGVWIGLPNILLAEIYFEYMPISVRNALLLVAFVMSFIYLVTDIPIKRLYSLPLILKAIKYKFRDIMLWIVPLYLAYMLAGGYIEGFFYDNVRDGILMNLVIGATIAITFMSESN